MKLIFTNFFFYSIHKFCSPRKRFLTVKCTGDAIRKTRACMCQALMHIYKAPMEVNELTINHLPKDSLIRPHQGTPHSSYI